MMVCQDRRSVSKVIDSIVHEMREITDHLSRKARRAKDHLKDHSWGLESTTSAWALARQNYISSGSFRSMRC
jgi:hypothetical protein